MNSLENRFNKSILVPHSFSVEPCLKRSALNSVRQKPSRLDRIVRLVLNPISLNVIVSFI